ncbi:MAG TPA: hypothetical protein VF227_03015 [Actinomycetes bacterium]
MTETVPEPPRRSADNDVEHPAEHQGDTEDVGGERSGESVEGAPETPEW